MIFIIIQPILNLVSVEQHTIAHKEIRNNEIDREEGIALVKKNMTENFLIGF